MAGELCDRNSFFSVENIFYWHVLNGQIHRDEICLTEIYTRKVMDFTLCRSRKPVCGMAWKRLYGAEGDDAKKYLEKTLDRIKNFFGFVLLPIDEWHLFYCDHIWTGEKNNTVSFFSKMR